MQIGSANLSAINNSVSFMNINDDSTHNFLQENQYLLH